MVSLPPCLRSFTLLDIRSVVCQSCEVPWPKLTRKSEFMWEPGAGPGARWTRVRRRTAARIHWLSRPTRFGCPQSARRVAGRARESRELPALSASASAKAARCHAPALAAGVHCNEERFEVWAIGADRRCPVPAYGTQCWFRTIRIEGTLPLERD